MSSVTQANKAQVEQAITAMLDCYRGNDWMINEHWPLNEPHVRLMIADIMSRFSAKPQVRVLDVGCFNGYIGVLLSHLGYQVVGTDACEIEERRTIFDHAGIEFVSSNMNELTPFKNLPTESFDIVIIAQVIEHILNHPLGLIRNLVDLMIPGGLMILTTPNPATVMGALRLLKGKPLLWGTNHFIDEPKIEGDRMISLADIHYREYTSEDLSHMLIGAGLRLEESRYIGLGSTRGQSVLKRLVKGNPLTRGLMSLRPFASNHYFVASKPRAEEH